MKTYNIKKGQYGGIVDAELILPDGFELITGGPNDVGEYLHNDCSHYLGCITKNEFEQVKNNLNSLSINHYDLGELVFISINDIQFLEEYPYLITSEEFNEKWDFKKYRIAKYSENFRLLGMNQIQYIKSEFFIKTLEVTNRDKFDHEWYKLEVITDYNLSNLLPQVDRKFKTIVSDNEICLKYWNQLISNIISQYGGFIPSDNVNINAAYEICKPILEKNAKEVINETIKNPSIYMDMIAKAERLMRFEEIEYN